MFSLLARGSRNEVGASDLTRLGVGAPRIRLSDLIPTSPHLGGLRPLYPAIDLWVVPLRGDVEVASYTSFIESSDHATSRWTWIDMTVACEWSVVIIHTLLLRGSFPAGAGLVLPSLFTAALVRVVLRELLRPLIGSTV